MIYKLIYTDEQTAVTDLLAKGILVSTETYAPTTQAVVHIGLIVDTPAIIVNGVITTPATYLDGWHVDVMTDAVYTFTNEVTPNNPKHEFFN